MLGVGLLVTPEIEVVRWGLIDRAPFPERTLAAELVVGDRSLHVVVFHSLTGVDYRRAKAAQFISITEYLLGLAGDVVLMGDANEPEVDAPARREIKLWKGNGKGAEYLFGPEPVHGLHDAWRGFLGDRVNDAPAAGPLAVSHRTRGNPRRYDHIYVPAAWTVTDMEYRYDEGTAAGSDHALVTAKVETGR